MFEDDLDYDVGPYYELGSAGSFIYYEEEEEERPPIGFHRLEPKNGETP